MGQCCFAHCGFDDNERGPPRDPRQFAALQLRAVRREGAEKRDGVGNALLYDSNHKISQVFTMDIPTFLLLLSSFRFSVSVKQPLARHFFFSSSSFSLLLLVDFLFFLGGG